MVKKKSTTKISLINEANLSPEEIQIIRRLDIIKGHLNAVEQMFAEDRPYEEIVMQLEAIRSALVKTTAVVAQNYVKSCLTNALQEGQDARESLAKPIDLLMKVTQYSCQ